MALLQIALAPDVPFTRGTLTLDGTSYGYELHYHDRHRCAFFTLLDEDGVALAEHLRLGGGVGWPSAQRWVEGAFYVEGPDTYALSDIADAVRLYYWELEET